MTRLPTPQQLTDLAEEVVARGFEAQRDVLADVVSAARRLGIRPVLADIVEDADAPRPVRERALGRLIVAMTAVLTASASPATSDAASVCA